MSSRLSVFFLVVLSPLLVWAQPLADRVPADAIVFASWQGADELGPAYDKSIFKKFLSESNLPQLVNETLPKGLQMIGQFDRSAQEAIDFITTIGGPMWRHPSAFYFGGIDFTNPRRPSPKIAFLCDAKAEAPALLEKVQEALAKMGRTPVPVTASLSGTIVIVEIGKTTIADTAQGKGELLSNSPAFKDAIAKTQKSSFLVGYLNMAELVKTVDEGMDKAAGPREKEMWNKAADVLGLRGVKFGILTAGFEGEKFGMQGFISAPGEQKGLMSLMDPTPLSKEIIATIPVDATVALAGKFDLGGLMTKVKSAVESFDPRSAQQMNEGIAGFNEQIGLDIEKDFLATLGNEWAIYLAPNRGGDGFLGFTLINKLRDAKKFDESLAKLETTANDMMQMLTGRANVHVKIKQKKIGEANVHYLAIPLITPAWVVRDGNVYVSLYPQIAATASEHVASKGQTLAENPGFTGLLKELGQPNPCGFTFYDLPRTAADGYQMLLLMSRLYVGLAELFGVDAPVAVIPPLPKILPLLSVAGSVSWGDADGYHTKVISPFPGSESFAGGSAFVGTGIGEIAVLSAILTPSLNRAREQANRVKCMSNLRQIGTALMMHANENKGQLPDSLGELVKKGYLTPQVFACPSSHGEVPPDVAGMNADEQAAWADNNSPYIYLGKGKKVNRLGAADVVVYEQEFNHDNGINLLYGDGHVEFKNTFEAEKDLERAGVKKEGGMPDPGLQ